MKGTKRGKEEEEGYCMQKYYFTRGGREKSVKEGAERKCEKVATSQDNLQSKKWITA